LIPNRFDYVIVGAGTAGCVLASRLSEDPDTRVCLIEAGGPAHHPFIRVPALVGAAIGHREFNWGLQTTPQPALDGRRIALPRGRVVGGSGSINGMAYHRGHPLDYDDWATAGNTGWSAREVLPYFLRTENNADLGNSPLHGVRGEIHVSHIPNPNALNADFAAAFAELGEFPPCTDFTGSNPEGYGLRQATIHRGRRDSTASALLEPALTRPNLHLLTRTQVARVCFSGGRASGVEVMNSRGVHRIDADAETILCAGAMQSPQLLMLSGIGHADELRRHGISLQLHLPGVGENYHDHPSLPVTLEMRNPVSYGISWRTLPRSAWNLLEYLLAHRGALASNVFESTAFLRTEAGLDRPDIQIAFQPARRNTSRFPLPLGHGFAFSVVNMYPHSRGRIRLADSDPRSAPLIDAGLFTDARDLEPMLRGLRIVRRLAATRAFARYRAHEALPGPAVQSDAEFTAYLRRSAATAHHPVGTCRMGSDDAAVVAPDLKVRGVNDLRVVDASVFPGIVGGNTNAPVVMVAEKAADMIRGRPAAVA
jgi:choline dehydrogenase